MLVPDVSPARLPSYESIAHYNWYCFEFDSGLSALQGLNIEVHVKNGRKYEGILKTVSPQVNIALYSALKSGIRQNTASIEYSALGRF